MSEITQRAFAAGLFEASRPPAGLVAWNEAVPQRRYGVYRNNVTASLTGSPSLTLSGNGKHRRAGFLSCHGRVLHKGSSATLAGAACLWRRLSGLCRRVRTGA